MAAGGAGLRLFVAVEVPEAHKLSVEKAVQDLRLRLPEARWTPRESWHATIKFLGEVPEERLTEVGKIAATVSGGVGPIATRLTGLGGFPNLRRPRVLWVGLDDPEGSLGALAGVLERRFRKRGFRGEARKFHPHLTLARFRVPRPIEEPEPLALSAEPFEITETVLFRSHLSPKGSTYEALARFPF